MEFTREDKLEMAKQIRSKNVIEPIITTEYEKNLDLVLCEERNIATREGDCHVYIITPKEKKATYPLYINIHGGGFVRPYGKRDTIFCARVASELGCKVIDIDYKLAPEYPFPAAFNECYDVVKWAFENAEELNTDKANIIVGGHSAGGNLTAAVALKANQTKEFKIKFQVMDYPFMDMATDPADKATEGDVIPVDRARKFNALYVENEEDKYSPFVSMVLAKKEMLIDLPAALVITAEKDSLRFEAEKYAMMMVEAGVEVKAKRFLNSKHGFVINCQGEFEEGQKLIIDTLRQAFYNV